MTRAGVTGWGSGRDDLASVLPEYELGTVLGRGAFGVVYAGRHRRLERTVAIKCLAHNLMSDPDVRRRFALEARVLAALGHPHVIQVHDLVEDGTIGVIVMELLTGGTLADRVALSPPSLSAACAYAVAALHGIQHAHERRVLHLDLKPSNLLLDGEGVLKVADFGIAQVAGQSYSDEAKRRVRGTPAYMAPEQADPTLGALSPATDVWAVGAILYELLAGAQPFAIDDDVEAMLRERTTSEPAPLRERNPQIPAAIADTVMRALHRFSDQRFQTAAAFAQSLQEAVAHDLGPDALESAGVPIHLAPPRSPSGVTLDRPEHTRLPGLRLPRSSVRGAILLAIVAVIAAANVLLRTGEDPSTGVSPTPTAPAPPPAPGEGKETSQGADVRTGTSPHPASSPDALPRSKPPGNGVKSFGRAPASLPASPAGWPDTMALGYEDAVGRFAGVSRRLGRGAFAIERFDVNSGANAERTLARRARTKQLFPLAFYYDLRDRGIREARHKTDDLIDTYHDNKWLEELLLDRLAMKKYWRAVRTLLKRLGASRLPTALVVERSAWAALARLEGSPEPAVRLTVPVGATGLRELRGIANDISGFTDAWLVLRDRYAPKVLLGWGMDDYGTGSDLSQGALPVATVKAEARQAARFLTRGGHRFDFAAMEIAHDEEGAFDVKNDDSKVDHTQAIYSPAEKRTVVEYIRAFVGESRAPVVLIGVPVGNTVMQTIDDKAFHWRDSWTQWLFGDHFRNLRRARDAGVIGVQFGFESALAQSTCPCDASEDGVTNDGPSNRRKATSSDDDGGYVAARGGRLWELGGMPLRR